MAKFKLIAVALVLLFILPSVGAVVYHYGIQERQGIANEEEQDEEEQGEEEQESKDDGENMTETYNFTYSYGRTLIDTTESYDSSTFSRGVPADLYVWSYTDIPSWATFTILYSNNSKYYYHLELNKPTTQGTFVLKAHGVPTGSISQWEDIDVNLTIKVIDCLRPGMTYLGSDNLNYVLDNDGNLTVSKTGEYTYVTALQSSGLKLKTAEPTTGIQIIPYFKGDGVSFIKKVIIGNGITGVMNGQMGAWSATAEERNLPTYEVIVGDGVTYFSYNFCVGSAVSRLYLGKDVIFSNSYPSTSEMYSMCTGAVKLTEIEVHPDNPYFKSVDGALFSKDGKVLLGYPLGNSRTHYEIPEGTETMAENMFYPTVYNGTGSLIYMQTIPLKSVAFPATFKMISAGAFQNAFNINELIFKSSDPVSFGYLRFGPTYTVYGQNVTMDVKYNYSMVGDDPSTISVPNTIFSGCGGFYFAPESPDDVKVYSHNNWANSTGYFNKSSTASASYAKLGQKLEKFNYYDLYYIDYNTDGNIDRGYQKPSGVTTLPDKTKQHYTLNGWYDAPSGGTKIGDAGQTFTFNADTTVYSQWLGNIYTTTYVITQPGTNPSSISAITNRRYPYKAPLPTVTKEHCEYGGWNDTTASKSYTADKVETDTITQNTILQLVLATAVYTTIFKDADGAELASYVQEYNAQQTVQVPTNDHNPTAFNLVGWFIEGSQNVNPDIEPNVTQYTPISSRTFVRKYTYSRTLRSPYKDNNWQDVTLSGTIFPGIVNAHVLPKQSDSSKPTKSGFRLSGWSTANNEPDIEQSPTPIWTDTYTPIYKPQTGQIGDDTRFASSTDIYSTWSPAELESISLLSSLLITKKPDEKKVTVEFTGITTVPSDWAGQLTWDSNDVGATTTGGTYIKIESSGNRNAIITALRATVNELVNIWATAKKRTWEPASPENTITSNNTRINISEYMQVLFYTLNNSDVRVPYTENIDGYIQSAWYVEHNPNPGPGQPEYSWVNPYEQGYAYPHGEPLRNGYQFITWIDDKGKAINEQNPPKYPMVCDASWMSTFIIKPKDTLILQMLNLEDSAIIQQMDMGTITSLRETFELSVSATPTPTMTSENTFLTDLSCTESIPVDIIRTNPKFIDDDQTDSLKWSNAKWITEVRKLVDRWQSNTDGIKVLFIPKGMKVINVNGEDIGVGDNYDMLGYVKKKTEMEGGQIVKRNYGVSYDANRVLVGYNAIITHYQDSYVAGTNNAITVSLTFSLGGMKSQYQKWADGLLLR